MRRKVRGLRSVERSVLKRERKAAEASSSVSDPGAPLRAPAHPLTLCSAEEDSAGHVVLDYCAVVRGILNDDQGEPLHPAGLRMAEALGEVRDSIQRNLDEKKRGFAESQLGRLANCIDRGLEHVRAEQETIQGYVEEISKVAATIESKGDDGQVYARTNSSS
jgi:hypothetical protein